MITKFSVLYGGRIELDTVGAAIERVEPRCGGGVMPAFAGRR